MDTTYRGFLSDNPKDTDLVSWEVEHDNFPWFDFIIRTGTSEVSFYGPDNNGDPSELLEKLENLKEQIDNFIDAVETA